MWFLLLQTGSHYDSANHINYAFIGKEKHHLLIMAFVFIVITSVRIFWCGFFYFVCTYFVFNVGLYNTIYEN